MPKLLQETAVLTEAAAAEAKKTGRMLVQFISPGWGSSGYYSPDVLEQAVTDQVIPAGTHMYADHPTEAEQIERPVRSVKDLMAVTTEAGRLSTDAEVAAGLAEEGAVVGEVQVVPGWRELVETVAPSIGVSIRGDAEVQEDGEAEGRSGRIVESLTPPVLSVDFVTRPGRGGRVMSVLESARANRRAVRRGVAEATVNDTREALQTALRDTHAGGENVWLWVRDFDEENVWFELEGSGAGEDAGVYGQGYTLDDAGAATLTGTRTEVRVRTTYVPVTRPGSNSSTSPSTTDSTAQESKEDTTMPKIQIEEAERDRLVEEAGRVTALEAERDTAIAERDSARGELAESKRADRGRELIATRATEAGVSFTTREVKGFLADAEVNEDGTLNEEAFTTMVDEDAAAKKEAAGHGRVSGLGGDIGVSESVDFDAFESEFYGTEKGA